MQVILLQKVPGLGDVDQVKTVADGYAINFLFPRHLAVQASPRALEELEALKSRRVRDEERDLREQQALADEIGGLELKFVEKANEKGLLYSAVTPQKIADKFARMGMTVDKRQVIVGQIKAVGEYEGQARLRHGLEAEFGIIVVADKPPRASLPPPL